MDVFDSLPPWDAIPYFQSIAESRLVIPAAGLIQVAPSDPMRIAMIVSTTAATVNLTMRGVTGTSQGMLVTPNTPPVRLLFSEVGPLCQQQWFAIGNLNSVVTVWLVALAKWPARRMPTRTGASRAKNP